MTRRSCFLRALPLGLVSLSACGSSGSSPPGSSMFDAGSTPSSSSSSASSSGPTMLGGRDGGGADAASSTSVFLPSGPVTDFPSPIVTGGAPSSAASLFGSSSQVAPSGGPCIVEPESDVLYPQDWLRPRFRWTASGGENLFELRLKVKNQTRDLVVYTAQSSWTMPSAMWDALRVHSPTEPMTLTIRGGVYSGGTLTTVSAGTSTSMGIAPVQATGAIVYWTTSNGTALMGFQVGDESVEKVLVPSQLTETSTSCIGCHTASPDGEFVGVALQGPNGWQNAMALVEADAGTVGTPPSFLGAGGKAALARGNQGIGSFSRAHWSPGDRREVVSYDDSNGKSGVLQWLDVEAKTTSAGFGTIARDGDPNLAGAPAWSHDGKTVAYVSTNRICDGRLGAGCDGVTYTDTSDPGSTADLYTVPYAGGAGGAATPVPGASSSDQQEYYPIFSPDDAWLAFARIPDGLNMYDQPQAEVYVIPASGGTATRLAANDPPTCSGQTSPGVTNSWPKWGPLAQSALGSTYYWLVFSSTRTGNPQLYVTSVVVTGTHVATHGSLYLWNQPDSENNHTPAWDTFKVPMATVGSPK